MSEVYLGDLPLWSEEIAKQMLADLCQQHNVPLDVFTDLVAIQRQYQDMTKARGVGDAISEVLSRMD
jgi:hypothetical protein